LLNSREQPIIVAPDAGIGTPFFYDTNRDNNVSAIDALLVVNHLNRVTSLGQGEGQVSAAIGVSEMANDLGDNLSDVILALALDSVEQAKRRRFS
jgi:hypothetical protein